MESYDTRWLRFNVSEVILHLNSSSSFGGHLIVHGTRISYRRRHDGLLPAVKDGDSPIAFCAEKVDRGGANV